MEKKTVQGAGIDNKIIVVCIRRWHGTRPHGLHWSRTPSVGNLTTKVTSRVVDTYIMQWRQREFKVGGTSLVSRLSACLTEANWWRLIAE